MPLTQQQQQQVLPTVSPPSPAEAPAGAQPISNHLVGDGVAAFYNLPTATRGGQAVNFYQLVSQLNNLLNTLVPYIDNADSAIANTLTQALQTTSAALQSQISEKAGQADLTALQQSVAAGFAGVKHLNVDFNAVADTDIVFGQALPAMINGVAVANGSNVLLMGQTDKTQNGLYTIVSATAGTLTRTLGENGSPMPLPAGSVLFPNSPSGAYAGSFVVLQGDRDVAYGQDQISFTAYKQMGVPGVDGVALKIVNGLYSFDPVAATPLVQAQMQVSPTKAFVVGDGTRTQFTITHGFNSNLFSWCEVHYNNRVDKTISPVVVDANNIQLNFSTPPAANSVVVVLAAYTGTTQNANATQPAATAPATTTPPPTTTPTTDPKAVTFHDGVIWELSGGFVVTLS